VWIVIDGAGFTHVSQLDPRTDVVTSDGEYAIWRNTPALLPTAPVCGSSMKLPKKSLYLIDLPAKH
jgi:hypothetical protein